MAVPALDLATYLAATSTAFTLGTNLFVGPVRAAVSTSTGAVIPVECAFARDSAGPSPQPLIGRTIDIPSAGVQLRVRGASTGYASAQALAQEAWNVLTNAKPSGYLDISADQSGPVYLRQDENGAHHWSLNFRAMYARSST